MPVVPAMVMVMVMGMGMVVEAPAGVVVLLVLAGPAALIAAPLAELPAVPLVADGVDAAVVAGALTPAFDAMLGVAPLGLVPADITPLGALASLAEVESDGSAPPQAAMKSRPAAKLRCGQCFE